MISWFDAAAWFLMGVLVARHFAYRSRSTKSEHVIIGIDRKRRRVTLAFTKLGGEFALGPGDAHEIGGYMQKQAEKLRGDSK